VAGSSSDSMLSVQTGACDVMSTRIKCPGYELCKRWFTQRASWRAHASCCCHAQDRAIHRTDKNGKVRPMLTGVTGLPSGALTLITTAEFLN